jgi:hypothetical protein
MVDSKADVAVVGADVVDPVGDDLVLEVVGVDLDRPTLRAIVPAAVLELAEQFLLLRVDRYDRLIGDLKLLDLGIDIFELGVAIGMFAAFLGLAVEMATILQPLQQPGNARGTHFVTHRAKRRRQLVVALGDPSQRSHRIAHRRGLEQSLQVHQQRCILRRQPRAAPPLRRTFPPSELESRKSFRPRPFVLRATFVAREAAAIPPYPAAFASAAALNRRPRSSSEELTASYRMRRGDSSIIDTDIDAGLKDRNPLNTKISTIQNPIQLFLGTA